MKLKIILLLVFGIIGFNKIHAYVYNIKVLDNVSQKIILCSDIHINDQIISGYSFHHYRSAIAAGRGLSKFVNVNQAMQFCAGLERFGYSNSLVIVEDMFYPYQGTNEVIEKYLKENKAKNYKDIYSGSFLALINLISVNNPIRVINCEFRHVLERDPEFARIFDINLLKIFTEFEPQIKEVSSYDDGDILNRFYAQLLEFCDVIRNSSGDNFVSQESISFIASELLNAKILHEIYNNNDKKYIFICAGASHINCIVQVLRKMNYCETMNFGFNDTFELNMPLEKMRRMDPVNMQECMNKILQANKFLIRARL